MPSLAFHHLSAVGELDPIALADLLWLWRTMVGSNPSGPPTTEDQPPNDITQAQAEPDITPGRRPATPAKPAGDDQIMPLYQLGSGKESQQPAVAVYPARAHQPMNGLNLMRAMRPLKRRWPHGRHTTLDVAAMIDEYAATRNVIPRFRRAPERWFDLDLVTDTSVSMSVWAASTQRLAQLLASLGAFRTVRPWEIAVDGSIRGPAGRSAGTEALRSPDRRRLIIVLSDCAAPAWRTPRPWLQLRAWAANTPTLLINPLPAQAWLHTALGALPTARLTSVVPGGPQRMPGLGTDDMHAHTTPLCVAALTPHAIGRWARSTMNANPDGCDGVLIPSDPQHLPRPRPDVWTATDAVESFRVRSSSRAMRLAVLCAAQDTDEFDVSLLHIIQQALVSDADPSDLAAVVTADLFEPADADGATIMRFRAGVRELLHDEQTAADAWDRYAAISRHVTKAAMGSPRFTLGIQAPAGPDGTNPETWPVAEATRTALEQIGLPQNAVKDVDVDPADAENTVRLKFSPDPAYVRTVRLVAAAVARRAGVADELIDEIRLAVGEACQRAVQLHRRGGIADEIELTMTARGRFTVQIIDHAPPSPPPDPDPWDEENETTIMAAVAREAGAAQTHDDLTAGVGLNLLHGLVPDIQVAANPDGRGTVVRMRWPQSRAPGERRPRPPT